MQRVTHATAKQDLFGAGKDGYTDGAPGVEAPTVLNSAAMNPIQEEIARAVELSGQTLNGADYTQLHKAILRSGAASVERTALSSFRQWITLGQTPRDICLALRGDGMIEQVCVVGSVGYIATARLNGELTTRTPAASYAGDFQACVEVHANNIWACGTAGEVQRSYYTNPMQQCMSAGGGQDLRAIASDGTSVVIMGVGTPAYRCADAESAPNTFTNYVAPHAAVVHLSYQNVGGGLWLALTSSGLVFTSPTALNAASWTQRFTPTGTSPSAGGFQKISYSPESGFVFDILHGTGPNRSVAYSADGLTWSQSAVDSMHPDTSLATVGHFNAGYTTARLVNFVSGTEHSDLYILKSGPSSPGTQLVSAPAVIMGDYAVEMTIGGGRMYVATFDGSSSYKLYHSALMV